MSTYLIHSCEKRKWYVDEYLVPSLIEQGIEKENILIYNDDKKEGCLKSFIESSKMIDTVARGTWHLQDDIIISSNFKEITEEFDKGIVCGFCSYYSKDLPMGIRPVNKMWYSFPCIRIPNAVLKGFIKWLQSATIQTKYQAYLKDNKFVDLFFNKYVTEAYPEKMVHNLCPNIVDNVDYLIGGSTINHREDIPVSLYFPNRELIYNLKRELEKI